MLIAFIILAILGGVVAVGCALCNPWYIFFEEHEDDILKPDPPPVPEKIVME